MRDSFTFSFMSASSNSRRPLALVLAPPLTAAIMALTWSTDFVRELENVTIDWRFNARASSDPPPDPRIVLVGIDDQALKKFGRWQDWSRTIHADLLEALAFRPPRVVAFDLFFSENSKNPEEDIYFADSLALHPGAITGMYVETSREALLDQRDGKEYPAISLHGTRPFPNVQGDRSKLLSGPTASTPIQVIAESSWTASVNCPPSRIDGMRREIPLLVNIDEEVYPSLVLQILMQEEEVSREDVKIQLGEFIRVPKRDSNEHWEIPIDESGFLYLNYRDTNRLVDHSYVQIGGWIAREVELGEPWPEGKPPIENQILIIGQSAEGLSDFGPSPYRAEEALFRVQATALDSILREDYIRQIPLPVMLTGWLVIAWMTLFLLRKAPTSLAIVIPIVIIVAIILSSFLLFRTHSLLVPLALPIVGFVLIHTVITGDRLVLELREKKYIQGVFGSYVSPDVVNQIISSGETPELGGEKVEITILFSDIQGFSTFSEQLEPEALVELMVEYLSEMTDIVTDRGGTLDKYIGDAIDAMYGAPLPLEDHAYRGVLTAIEMQRMQLDLCERWKKSDRPDLVKNMRTRIGLNTGPAVVGNMGSRRRFNYTMMGDNVNLAARFESGAKAYGVYTMITGETLQAARDTRDDIVCRLIDQIVVKGRTLPVEAYEVVEQKSRVEQETLECISLYESAMDAYRSQDWETAIRRFEEAGRLERFQPDRDPGILTNPSRVMAARCRILEVDPPGDDWDGIYRMTTK